MTPTQIPTPTRWPRRCCAGCSVSAAAKNLPLGMVGLDGAEYGPQSLPAFDALISEHERAYRRQVLA